jgi:ribosomal protein S18 acetylase RimI-like enzyme
MHSKSLSEHLWSLEWKSSLRQLLLPTGVVAEHVDIDDLWEFMNKNYHSIYQIDHGSPQFYSEINDSSRRAYYEHSADSFLFKLDNHAIGALIIQPVDWETLYLRNVSFLPSYQGLGIYQSFLEFLIATLSRRGVEKLTVDIAPANLRHIHILNKFGFYITGMTTTVRWGVQLNFTKFLNEKSKNHFVQNFNYYREPSTLKPAGIIYE